jgi:serine O-acetyltransferase
VFCLVVLCRSFLLAVSQTLSQLLVLLQSDNYRYNGQLGWKSYLKNLWKERGLVVSTGYRLARFTKLKQGIFWRLAGILTKGSYRLLQAYYQFELPYRVPVGYGLCLYHLNGLVVNSQCVLGNNITLSHQVTLGDKPVGAYAGSPTLGNEIFIAAGAKVVGGISIGSNTVIAPNAVVTKPVPDNAIVGGIPAVILSADAGSEAYCRYRDAQMHWPQLSEIPV